MLVFVSKTAYLDIYNRQNCSGDQHPSETPTPKVGVLEPPLAAPMSGTHSEQYS